MRLNLKMGIICAVCLVATLAIYLLHPNTGGLLIVLFNCCTTTANFVVYYLTKK